MSEHMQIIKKIGSLFGSALAVLLLSGFLSLQPIAEGPAQARHDGTPPCRDMTHAGVKDKTDPIYSPDAPGRKSGTPDSGQLNFNWPADHSEQACTDTTTQDWKPTGQPAEMTGAFIRGWAWNTNLGKVSFYCKDGDNLGEDCGPDVDYATVIFPSEGRIRGFAYGQNIGWVSMSCEGGSNMGIPCGAQEYGVQIAQDDNVTFGSGANTCGPINKGDLYGFAYTASVGYINFCGAHVEAGPLILPKVRFEASDPSGVTANGTDHYKIIVEIFQDNQKVADVSGLSFAVEQIKWESRDEPQGTLRGDGKVSLRADQVKRCRELDVSATDPCSASGSGAIKPQPGDFVMLPDKSGYSATIKAIAPTVYFDKGTRQYIPNADKAALEYMLLNIDGTAYALSGLPHEFAFAPAVEVTKIASISPLSGEENENRLSATRNSSEPAYLTISKKAGTALPPDDDAISIFAQLHDCENEDYYTFRFDEGEPGGITKDENGRFSEEQTLPTVEESGDIDRDGAICSARPSTTVVDMLQIPLSEFTANAAQTVVRLIYADASDTNAAIAGVQLNAALGLRTRVEYTATNGREVKYFSADVQDGAVLNQAADIRGNVRIDVQKMIKEGSVAQSIGNNPTDTQSKREKFYRVVKSAVGGKPVNTLGDGRAATISKSTTLSDGFLYYKRGNVAGNNPCKIVLNDASTLSFGKHVTIVGEGCDFYIDQNVIASANKTGRLGIVALSDLSMTGKRQGGNVYICHRVTDLEANIVADGSIFGYGVSETDCGADKNALIDADGFPKPPGNRLTAKRQLTIHGSILSNNTYGGSFLSTPILGDGAEIASADDVWKSRLYDINFLRYANTVFSEAFGVDCWADGVALSQTLGGTSCDNNSPDTRGIVNIIYRAPSTEMPIFKGVK